MVGIAIGGDDMIALIFLLLFTAAIVAIAERVKQ